MKPPPPIAMNSVGASISYKPSERCQVWKAQRINFGARLTKFRLDLLCAGFDGVVNVVVAQTDPVDKRESTGEFPQI